MYILHIQNGVICIFGCAVIQSRIFLQKSLDIYPVK